MGSGLEPGVAAESQVHLLEAAAQCPNDSHCRRVQFLFEDFLFVSLRWGLIPQARPAFNSIAILLPQFPLGRHSVRGQPGFVLLF